MNGNLQLYILCIKQFLDGKIDADAFQLQFISLFKQDNARFDRNAFSVLNGLFAEADSYSADAQLINSSPENYISESELRKAAKTAYEHLLLLFAGR